MGRKRAPPFLGFHLLVLLKVTKDEDPSYLLGIGKDSRSKGPLSVSRPTKAYSDAIPLRYLRIAP